MILYRKRPRVFRDGQAGQALIEFALTMPILILIAFGTFSVSQLLERYLTVLQLVRNAGNMYSRSVDFSIAQNRQLLLESSGGLSMTLNGGDGVVYLSTVQRAEAGANNGSAVVTHRIVIGNPGISASTVANPINVEPSGDVSDYDNDPLALATISNNITLTPGDVSYIVEAYHNPTDILMAERMFGQQRLTAGAYY